MKIKCGCKINLYLKITGKREDGYHNLDTIFLPLDTPYDILHIKKQSDTQDYKKSKKKNQAKVPSAKQQKTSREKQNAFVQDYEKNITVICKTKGIDLKNNTLTKAYALYAEATGFAPKLSVKLKKGIPHGAGLGGGSSDAAQLLLYLQKENKKPLSQKKLHSLACRVGADVPFFLYNIPCHALGVGEILTPISLKMNKKKYKSAHLVLVSPCQSVSTKQAFEGLNPGIFETTTMQTFEEVQAKDSEKQTFEKSQNKKSKVKKIKTSSQINDLKKIKAQKKILTKGDIFDSYQISCFIQNLHHINDFESGVFANYPFIGDIKNTLIKAGALRAQLSGTGSSIFGIFEKKEKAKKAVQILKELFLIENESKSKKLNTKKEFMREDKQDLNTKIRVYEPVKIL